MGWKSTRDLTRSRAEYLLRWVTADFVHHVSDVNLTRALECLFGGEDHRHNYSVTPPSGTTSVPAEEWGDFEP